MDDNASTSKNDNDSFQTKSNKSFTKISSIHQLEKSKSRDNASAAVRNETIKEEEDYQVQQKPRTSD